MRSIADHAERPRRVRQVSLAAAVTAALVACGDGGDDPAATASATRGVLRVQVSGGDGELRALQDLASAFERANPGVDVRLIGVAEQGEHLAKLATAFAGGSPPDAFLINYRRMGRFVDADVIEPTTIDAPTRAGLYEPAVQAFTFAGSLLCLPQNASSIVTYINPTLFARAGVAPPTGPWSWDDARATARTLSAAGVQAVGFEPDLRTVAPFVWSALGEVVDDTTRPTAVTFDSPSARRAIRYLLDLQELGLDATERAAASAEDQFAAGKVAMFFDSRRAVPGLRKAGVDFDVVPLPVDAIPANLLASDGWCVSGAGDHKAVAHAFARFAVVGDGARVLTTSGRTVPSWRALARSTAFLDPSAKPKNAVAFLDAIPTARALPSVAAWNEAEEVTNDTLARLFAGNVSENDAVEEITEETAEELARP